ncbi:MAG: hypothetical protein V4568_13825 [Pseudomonadota bacterium]
MAALAFTLGLFLYYSFVGFAVATALKAGRAGLQRILISPALGIATLVVPLFFLSRAGLPVARIAPAITIGFGLLALIFLVLRRPSVSWRSMRWPGLILVLALSLNAWPMARFGFDWGSFSNDDMANYCLAAQRFLQHGYYDMPDLAAYFAGKDYSSAYWYMHVAAGARPGSELMLAAVWAVSGLNAHQIFMPTIMALHLAVITAAAAAVAGVTSSFKRRRVVNITMLLMAVSPLSALGALYQLIAQVGGLALMTTAFVLLCQPLRRRRDRNLYNHLAILILLSAQLIWYPELLPFLGVAWFTWLALSIRRKSLSRSLLLQRFTFTGISLLVLLLLFNNYLVSVYLFMEGQARQGLRLIDPTSVYFPFYLIPSGIGNFWGLLPISYTIHEPYLSLAIALGILFSCGLIVCIYRQARQALSFAVMAAVMLGVGGMLFYRSNDFGLYKLAMYLQPTIAAVVAFACVSRGRSGLGLAIAGIFFTLQIPSQFAYVQRSTGNGAGGLTEIPFVSHDALPRKFGEFMKSLEGKYPEGYYSDSSNVVLAKLQSLYTQGRSFIFPSKEFYWGGDRLGDLARGNGYGDFWQLSLETHDKFLAVREIQLDPDVINRFVSNLGDGVPVGGRVGKRVLVANSSQFTVFNRFHRIEKEALFRVEEHPKNHLIFVNSSLGAHYYQPSLLRKRVSFYQLENDPMFPGRQISGVGRHMLLLAAGVTERPRLMLELSDTVLGQNGYTLPVPLVNGKQNQSASFVGRGSGRVITPPLVPIMVDGLPYFHIDLGRNGKQFPRLNNSVLMSLYGREVAADPRFLTAFARNISLLSEDEVSALVAPTALSNFPADLKDDGLQYSGLYEDGWISEHAFAILAPRDEANTLVIKGMVPLIAQADFHTTLTVLLDGHRVAEKRLGLGDYEVKVPTKTGVEDRKVELVFDGYQVLPGGDGRPTAGMIKFIGFVKE